MDGKINYMNQAETQIKRRVLFVITQSEWGGAQKFLYNLISNLNQDKYELLLVAGESKKSGLFDELKKIGVNAKMLKFLRRSINPYYDTRATLELRDLIEEFKPDVLFLNSSKTGIIGSLAAKKFFNIKVIYRIGGWAFNDPRSWIIRQFYILGEKYTAKYKDFIIVNSRHDFEQARKLKIRPRRELKLIYNGIDPYKLEFLERGEAKIKLAAALCQKQKNFLQSNFVIGTIANFYQTKGLQYLIRAAKVFYSRDSLEVVFVIIGDGPERKNLELEIKNSGLENQVFLAGTMPDAYKYLPAFDVFVLPSVKEGFPWALLEAMSAKLPVIATKVGANTEIIENEKNGLLVEPGKPEEIALAVKRLMNNEDMRRELGIQAHQTVLLKFGQNKMLKQVEDLF